MTLGSCVAVTSPERMPDSVLRDIFKFMMDEGLRVPVSATIVSATSLAGTITLTVVAAFVAASVERSKSAAS